jgi:HPt (histidine-containing phosphotransfer) domain-containing protein
LDSPGGTAYGSLPPAAHVRVIGARNRVTSVTSEPTSIESLPAWDRDAFEGYTDWMPLHRVEKLLELFRDRTRAAIAELPSATSDAAWEKEAHALLYSAGTLGFVRLAEACRLVQGLIRKGSTPTREDRDGLLKALSAALEASDIDIDPPTP